MDDGVKKALKTVAARVDLIRKLSILFAIFSLFITLSSVFVVPNQVPLTVRLWIVSINCVIILFIAIGLWLVKKDVTTTLLLTHLNSYITGLVTGITVVILAYIA